MPDTVSRAMTSKVSIQTPGSSTSSSGSVPRLSRNWHAARLSAAHELRPPAIKLPSGVTRTKSSGPVRPSRFCAFSPAPYTRSSVPTVHQHAALGQRPQVLPLVRQFPVCRMRHAARRRVHHSGANHRFVTSPDPSSCLDNSTCGLEWPPAARRPQVGQLLIVVERGHHSQRRIHSQAG